MADRRSDGLVVLICVRRYKPQIFNLSAGCRDSANESITT